MDISFIKDRFSSNENIGEGESNFDDKYVEKVFNWAEVHLSEMTCYKIHTLVNNQLNSSLRHIIVTMIIPARSMWWYIRARLTL